MPAIARWQDANRLVYVRNFEDTNLWSIDTSQSSITPAPAISSTKHEYHCEVSPDGKRIAFSSSRSGDPEIWVSGLQGENAIQITSLRAQDTNNPRWSPDGKMIAFASNAAGEFDIYIVRASGGKPERLTTHPAIDISQTFSRDGKWIYFASMRSGDYRIWKMPVSGGEAIRISSSHGVLPFESFDGNDLYHFDASVASPVWRLPLSGGEPVKVLDGVLWFNLWLRETGAYYIDGAASETRLQYLDFATGKSTTIVRNLGNVSSGLTSSPDGKTLFYVRLDSAIDDLMLVDNFR
jgi:Tol biopolymer transport system component